MDASNSRKSTHNPNYIDGSFVFPKRDSFFCFGDTDMLKNVYIFMFKFMAS